MSNENQLKFDILSFWWEAGFKRWFSKDVEFDKKIEEKFLNVHEKAVEGEFDEWTESPHGTLALLILLDQFPRNMFRDTERAFATDTKALSIAQTGLEGNQFMAYPKQIRSFFFLPFEHAEDMDAQDISVEYFQKHGERDGYFYALIHMDIIRRFGRFPHRNKILGRESTKSELQFLNEGGFAG